MNNKSHTATRLSAKGPSDRGVFLGLLRIVFPRVIALIYTGGTVAHILRLIVLFDLTETPFWVDWVLVILGPIGVIGLIVFSKDIRYRGRWEHITDWLIFVHLSISVAFHVWIIAVGSHEAVSVFPYAYSYFATAYFGFFAWRSWTMQFKPE